jgi:hypothetical protein
MGDSMSTIINATTANGVVIQPDNSGSLVLQTNNGTTAVTIDTSQNVGIGTTSPATKLHVFGNNGVFGTSAFFGIGSSNSGIAIGNNATIGYLQGATTATSGVTADIALQPNGGNVGIGTTSPTNFGSNFKMLAVQGSDFGVMQAISSSGSTTLEMMGASGVGYVGTRTNHPLVLRTNDTERMRITSGGLVGINSNPTMSWLQVVQPSSSSFVAGRFQHPGNATFGVVMSLETTGGSDNPALSFKNNNGGSPAYYSINCASNGTLYFNTNGSENGFGTQRISFDSSGNAYKGSGAGSWLSLSDERIKTNIEDVTGGLSRILQLRPRTFDYKQPDAHNGKIHEKGFIAQEIEAVYPNSVTETDFILEQDKQYFAEGEKAKAIGFNSEFYADLVKAIQEQQTIINDLKARIETLEAK